MKRSLVLVTALLWTGLAAALFVAGCKDGADDFFSGRPSGMSMVHNRIIGGPPETMVELLRVPSRFPDATPSHIASWQASAIAWWLNAEKHQLMVASFGKISREEMRALGNWVAARDGNTGSANAKALDEIGAAIKAAS